MHSSFFIFIFTVKEAVKFLHNFFALYLMRPWSNTWEDKKFSTLVALLTKEEQILSPLGVKSSRICQIIACLIRNMKGPVSCTDVLFVHGS